MRKIILLILLIFLLYPSFSSTTEELEKKREEMVNLIKSRGVKDEKVLKAMLKVPRHLFVDKSLWNSAYGDFPLPIGFGQTISQPYIVALMTESLRLKGDEKVLEIGTGSGYQAAILAEITKKVYTVEIIKELADRAKERLRALGYTYVMVKWDDGYYGWKEYAPYDAIIVTCAPDHVPPPLIQQLKEGGRMVIPVGPPGMYQTLWLIEKKDGKLKFTDLGGVLFVPLQRRK
ncbi:MAG: protein-L-isoaspartate(D-aspartate) O-methyltransferase [Dictyoglomus sp.]|nr:protein-L-isoaspartate(D-aspartate) O-methyltransferase [Dictyoglomus sp.]MDW8188825.1 protein-L-isoaspartate(D-aspartate) O-methyltransferase [Dictyoglomus sp.]